MLPCTDVILRKFYSKATQYKTNIVLPVSGSDDKGKGKKGKAVPVLT
jgi:hypothetical protein